MTSDTKALVHALCLVAATVRAGLRDEREPDCIWADEHAARILGKNPGKDGTIPALREVAEWASGVVQNVSGAPSKWRGFSVV